MFSLREARKFEEPSDEIKVQDTNRSEIPKRSSSLPNLKVSDTEVKALFAFIRKEPETMGDKVKLLRTTLLPQYQDPKKTHLSKIREELNDILIMNNSENFKDFYQTIIQSHGECESDCPHLKDYYTKIGFDPKGKLFTVMKTQPKMAFKLLK